MIEMEKVLISNKFGEENIDKKYKMFKELKSGIENLFDKYNEKDFEYVLNCSRLILDNIESNFN